MEKILEDVSYEATDFEQEHELVVDKKYVEDHMGTAMKSLNLNKFIL